MNENMELEKDTIHAGEASEVAENVTEEIEETAEVVMDEPDAVDENVDTVVETSDDADENAETVADALDAVDENVDTVVETSDAVDENVETVTDAPDAVDENVDTCDEKPEITYTSDFKVGDIRKRAKEAMKGNTLKTIPKALLYMVLMMIPTMLVYILGSFKSADAETAGKAIEIIGILLPVIFGGPLTLGFVAGVMKICRGEKFKVKDLFALFTDARFGKTTGVYIMICLMTLVIMLVLQLPLMFLSSVLYSNVLFFSYEILTLIITEILLARFYMAFPLIADNPDMKVMEALKLSFRAMKGNTVKLILTVASYIGWYLLFIAVGIAAISVIYLIGMSAMSGITDYLSYYMAMMKFMLIYYITVYLVLMVVYSFILVRPSFAFSAFYDTLFCREWPERQSEPADPFDWEPIDSAPAQPESEPDAENISEPAPEDSSEATLVVTEPDAETAPESSDSSADE